jgi:hypothetical protein
VRQVEANDDLDWQALDAPKELVRPGRTLAAVVEIPRIGLARHSCGDPHDTGVRRSECNRGLLARSLFFILAVVAAAGLLGSCAGSASSDGNAPAAAVAVTVAPTAPLDAEVATTVVVPESDVELTSVPVPESDAVTTSAEVARLAPQAAPMTVPPTVAPVIGAGDLGLNLPITELECRGQFLTIVGTSVDPAQYRHVVSDVLAAHPGSNYARTEYACSSLLPRMPNGNAIYVVFYGPFNTVLQACTARASVSADAYVKILYDVSPDDGGVDC